MRLIWFPDEYIISERLGYDDPNRSRYDYFCLSDLGKFSQLFWVKIFHHKERGENKIWQEGYHPEAIKSTPFFAQKLDYIHDNPVKKGFVVQPEHWKYSSARNYLLGDDRLIVIGRVE